MYKHLARLGVVHIDIRHANILMAPECPQGWPTLLSPFTKRPYRYRLIDFVEARKADWTQEEFKQYHED